MQIMEANINSILDIGSAKNRRLKRTNKIPHLVDIKHCSRCNMQGVMVKDSVRDFLKNYSIFTSKM